MFSSSRKRLPKTQAVCLGTPYDDPASKKPSHAEKCGKYIQDRVEVYYEDMIISCKITLFATDIYYNTIHLVDHVSTLRPK